MPCICFATTCWSWWCQAYSIPWRGRSDQARDDCLSTIVLLDTHLLIIIRPPEACRIWTISRTSSLSASVQMMSLVRKNCIINLSRHYSQAWPGQVRRLLYRHYKPVIRKGKLVMDRLKRCCQNSWNIFSGHVPFTHDKPCEEKTGVSSSHSSGLRLKSEAYTIYTP